MVAAALQVEVPQPRAPRGRTGALIVLVFSLARRQFPPYLGIRPGLWYCKCSSETVLLLPSVFNGSLQLTGEPHHCRNGPLVGVGGHASVSWQAGQSTRKFWVYCFCARLGTIEPVCFLPRRSLQFSHSPLVSLTLFKPANETCLPSLIPGLLNCWACTTLMSLGESWSHWFPSSSARCEQAN